MIHGSLREVFESMLADYYEVHMHVVAHADLVIPDHVKQKPPVATRLVYGLDLPTPIDDMKVDDAGVRATLSFSRTPFETFVPWGAVAAVEPFGKRPKQRAQLRSV